MNKEKIQQKFQQLRQCIGKLWRAWRAGMKEDKVTVEVTLLFLNLACLGAAALFFHLGVYQNPVAFVVAVLIGVADMAILLRLSYKITSMRGNFAYEYVGPAAVVQERRWFLATGATLPFALAALAWVAYNDIRLENFRFWPPLLISAIGATEYMLFFDTLIDIPCALLDRSEKRRERRHRSG